MNLILSNRKNDEGYITFVSGWLPEDPPGIEGLLTYDTAFNLISIDSVPRQMWDLMNSKWMMICRNPC